MPPNLLTLLNREDRPNYWQLTVIIGIAFITTSNSWQCSESKKELSSAASFTYP